MKKIPNQVINGFSPCEKRVIKKWWTQLDETTQIELSSLWMMDLTFNRKHHKMDLENESHHPQIDAKFVESEDELDDDFWNKDFYDYLVNHEIYLSDFEYRFHVCTQHEAAKAVVKAGFIPSNFICPLRHKSCPIRTILNLNPGKSLKFVVYI